MFQVTAEKEFTLVRSTDRLRYDWTTRKVVDPLLSVSIFVRNEIWFLLRNHIVKTNWKERRNNSRKCFYNCSREQYRRPKWPSNLLSKIGQQAINADKLSSNKIIISERWEPQFLQFFLCTGPAPRNCSFQRKLYMRKTRNVSTNFPFNAENWQHDLRCLLSEKAAKYGRWTDLSPLRCEKFQTVLWRTVTTGSPSPIDRSWSIWNMRFSDFAFPCRLLASYYTFVKMATVVVTTLVLNHDWAGPRQ